MKTITRRLHDEELQYMPKNAKKAFIELEALGAPVNVWWQTNPKYLDYRGFFWISSEEENSGEWADYHGKFWGSDKLNEILKKNGLYFEWENAAVGCVYNLG